MQIKDIKDGAHIEYPCRWTYRIIGRNEKEMREAVQVLIQDDPCEVIPSRVSATGKYVSLNVEVEVSCEEKRTSVYESLRNHPSIILVL
ncbi:MAG: DUF493 domain-containing protein [Syntrophales bacterium]|nr:DUF493 domain-containing protein [Syntrophales bacterium]